METCLVHRKIVHFHCRDIRPLDASILKDRPIGIRISTWLRLTLVNVHITRLTIKSGKAITSESRIQVLAMSTINTGHILAIINVLATILSFVSNITLTFVTVNAINADTINARLRRAFINIDLAIVPSESWFTTTVVSIDQIMTSTVILTWRRITFIDFNFALFTSVSSFVTVADGIVPVVNTDSTMVAVAFTMRALVTETRKERLVAFRI